MPRTIHGHAKKRDGGPSKDWARWKGMLARCQQKTHSSYKNYGGRGIKVCERWKTFTNFLADMGQKPPGMSLDRINNDGDYEPSNCRWASPKQQGANTRRVKLLTYNGVSLNRRQWELALGLAKGAIARRFRAGWTIDRALGTPRMKTGLPSSKVFVEHSL